MTKRKNDSFNGAWMSSRLTDAAPVPTWADDATRAALVERDAEAESAAWQRIADRVTNEPGDIDPAPVLAALRRAVEVWRFEQQRYAATPEVKQWGGLLRKVRVPESLDPFAALELQNAIRRLPAQVQGVLDHELFRRADIGASALFHRMREGDTTAPELLRSVLSDMAAGLALVRAKRGPRLRAIMVDHLRHVHTAIVAASKVSDVPARALAADLLREVGIPAPAGRSQLAEIFRQ